MIVPRIYKAPVGTPEQMTGKADAPAWQAAPWSQYFVDIQGTPHRDPHLQTRMKMLWDESYLYIAAWMEEPNVWATLEVRDSVIFQDNDFEVFLDPDGDALNYFEFEVNAFGTIWDLFLAKPYRDGGSADSTWDSESKVAVFVDGTINDPLSVDRGWGVEIAMPWAGFAKRASVSVPRAGDRWRINFSRVQWYTRVVEGQIEKIPDHPEENWVWSPQGVIDMHQPEMWGTVEFVK